VVSSVSVGHLAQLAEVHGSDAVADALDDGQVVADDDQMSLWMSAPAAGADLARRRRPTCRR
jgi:hypothetical protein